MSKSWASEKGPFYNGDCIIPRFMVTPHDEKIELPTKNQLLPAHFFKKLFTTEEVADVVRFLLSASPIGNGQNNLLNKREKLTDEPN